MKSLPRHIGRIEGFLRGFSGDRRGFPIPPHRERDFPMQDVLQQLIGKSVFILTTSDEPNLQPRLFNVKPSFVDDSLAFVSDGVSNSVVSISEIIATAFSSQDQIELLPNFHLHHGPEPIESVESSLRELFNTVIGSKVTIIGKNGSIAENFTVEKTGLGIVVGLLTVDTETGPVTLRVAVSLFQISQVVLSQSPTTT